MSQSTHKTAELETTDGWISIQDLQSGNSWLGKRLSKRLKNRSIEFFSLAKQKLWHTSKLLIHLGNTFSKLFVSKAHPFESMGKCNSDTGNIMPYPAPVIITSGRIKIHDVLLLPHHKNQYHICLFSHPAMFYVKPNEKVGCRHLQAGHRYETNWQIWDIGQVIGTQTVWLIK